MNDPTAEVARRAAQRLAPALSQPRLPAQVEAELRSETRKPLPQQYVDPISLAGLIVSVASLAWTIYSDTRHKSQRPKPDVVARTIRVRLQGDDSPSVVSPAERDRIIEVIVNETVKRPHRETTD